MNDTEIIKKYKKTNKILHLSKNIIDAKNLVNSPQLLAMGFNVGGRPDGLWFAQGALWLDKAYTMQNPKFPNCCYIYSIDPINYTNLNILTITDDAAFEKFDKEFSAPGDNYWLNLDYFTMNFTDYITDLQVISERKCVLNLCKLKKLPGESTWDILIKNKIIFADAGSAFTNCEFFKNSEVDVERFRYKNWAHIAKKYDGIYFKNWNLESLAQKYFWFQSLDIASGCIWNFDSKILKLQYEKIDNKWQKI